MHHSRGSHVFVRLGETSERVGDPACSRMDIRQHHAQHMPELRVEDQHQKTSLGGERQWRGVDGVSKLAKNRVWCHRMDCCSCRTRIHVRVNTTSTAVYSQSANQASAASCKKGSKANLPNPPPSNLRHAILVDYGHVGSRSTSSTQRLESGRCTDVANLARTTIAHTSAVRSPHEIVGR